MKNSTIIKSIRCFKLKITNSVAILSLIFALTLMPKDTFATPFIGYEALYVGYACDGHGKCYQSYVVNYYVFGIKVKTDYVIEECVE